MEILAMSGGLTEPFDRYLLDLTGVDDPWVCYIPTAAGDDLCAARAFQRIHHTRCEVVGLLSLFDRQVDDIDSYLRQFDVIYVGGGNTVSMLGVWRAHGVDKILRDIASSQRTILAGVSAGALCWFRSGLTDAYGPTLRPFESGLGFLPFNFTPHAKPVRREAFFGWVVNSGIPGYALEDNTALYFQGGALVSALRSTKRARAFEYVVEDGEVFQQTLKSERVK